MEISTTPGIVLIRRCGREWCRTAHKSITRKRSKMHRRADMTLMRRMGRFATISSPLDKPGQCIYLHFTHYMLVYSLIAFRIKFISPIISLQSQYELDQSSVVRCSRRLSLPTLIDPTLKWKWSGMQRGCVGWAQCRQTACDDHMDKCYSHYGTFPETCTLVQHRQNLKMSMGRGRSHGQRPGNLGCTSGCGWGVPIRQTSAGSALARPGGKRFPKLVLWE